jgi:hypothetical protein
MVAENRQNPAFLAQASLDEYDRRLKLIEQAQMLSI